MNRGCQIPGNARILPYFNHDKREPGILTDRQFLFPGDGGIINNRLENLFRLFIGLCAIRALKRRQHIRTQIYIRPYAQITNCSFNFIS
jgi:hypothetical protein